MKLTRIITTICLLFAFSITFAQEKKKEMIAKSFEYKKDGKVYPYTITTFKHSTSPIKLKPSDAGQLNQDRMETPKYVTKMIYIDDDMKNDYDKYLVMRYIKEDSDSFELKPTDKGFVVVVDDHHMEYIFGEGIYFVNNADKDFFIVDEFSAI